MKNQRDKISETQGRSFTKLHKCSQYSIQRNFKDEIQILTIETRTIKSKEDYLRLRKIDVSEIRRRFHESLPLKSCGRFCEAQKV